jgi:mono/diheme cytochrome c family protein
MLNNQHQPVRFGIGDRAGLLASLAKAVSISSIAQQNGAALYSQYCPQCHGFGNKDIRTPGRSLMEAMPFEDVLTTITTVAPNCQSGQIAHGTCSHALAVAGEARSRSGDRRRLASKFSLRDFTATRYLLM